MLSAVKDRQKALREQYQRDWQALLKEEKAAILQRKSDLAAIHDAGGNVAQALRARQKHLRDQQRALDEVTGRADVRRKAYLKSREKEQESLDAVTTDLETAMPEALGWWAANRNSPTFSKKLPKRMSRTEYVLHWLHDHPEAVNDYRMAEAERSIAEHEERLQRKQQLLDRKAHQRGTRRGMMATRGTGGIPLRSCGNWRRGRATIQRRGALLREPAPGEGLARDLEGQPVRRLARHGSGASGEPRLGGTPASLARPGRAGACLAGRGGARLSRSSRRG